MKRMLQAFWRDESGLGTIELVVLIAVLVAVALIFKDGIMGFLQDLMDDIFKVPDVNGSGTTSE